MSAARLREAAALMRQKADMAEPGRWKIWGMSVMADPLNTSDVADCVDVAHSHTPSTSRRRLHTGNAQHIASWHPAVALATATLLETVAEHIASHDCEAHCEPGGCDQTSAALAVANAYLGSDA